MFQQQLQRRRNVCGRADWSAPDFRTVPKYLHATIYLIVGRINLIFEKMGGQNREKLIIF